MTPEEKVTATLVDYHENKDPQFYERHAAAVAELAEAEKEKSPQNTDEQ